MELNLIQPKPASSQGGYQAPNPAAVKEATVLPKSETVQSAPKAGSANNKANNQLSDERRQELVQQGANAFKNIFAVSDVTFSIFKDSISGEYITRFTNLRDGRITYIPEPDVMDFLDRQSQERASLVAFDA